MNVHVTLPARPGVDATRPVVRRVAVRVPKITSLAESSLELDVEGHRSTTVQHNPRNGSLEWFDIPTHRDEPMAGALPRRFTSPTMAVLFHQPGELFAQKDLIITASIEVPGELLSGTQARLFDAQGYPYSEGRNILAIRTLLNIRAAVVLRDAFDRRLVSPYQSFHFDEIIPNPLRIADITAALADQRFAVRQWQLGANRGKRLAYVLRADRTNGPDSMTMLLFVEGHRHPTERQSRQPGGHRYTSKFDSGDLRVYVKGWVRRDSSGLVREINDLQLAPRERFRRLKAYR